MAFSPITDSANYKLMRTKLPGKRGRPAKKTFINVEILVKTRDALAEFKRITGLATQGEVLDYMVADILRRRPK